MNDYDIIVVGLGPAGTAACLELALGGARVLAIDGGSWQSKPCGGCVARRWEWLLDWLGLPAWAKSHPVRDFRLAAPGAPALEYSTANPGAYLLDRARLDDWLAGKAAGEAAEVIQARAQTLRPKERGVVVTALGREFHAPFLIAADGATGICRRTLKPRFGAGNRYLAMGEELIIPGHGHPDGRVLLELGGVAKGYAWLFARGDVLNLGLGLWDWPNRQGRAKLRQCYSGFMARLGIKKSGNPRGAVIPCPTLFSRPMAAQGRVLFVGTRPAQPTPSWARALALRYTAGVWPRAASCLEAEEPTSGFWRAPFGGNTAMRRF